MISENKKSGIRLFTRMVCPAVVYMCLIVFCISCGNGYLHEKKSVKRYGSVIGVREEKLEEYKKLHAAVWPDVLKMIKACNIENYSIYLRKLPDGKYYLFSYFEYTGSDFDGDMAKMAADPTTRKWWDVCEPCQQPLPDRKEGQWWADMEEVFHCD